MKTPLTFLLSLTFLFLFSGSVYGDESDVFTIPNNARLDFTGHNWVCNKGFTRQGRECNAVDIPNNARLDFRGHNWVCNKGFTRQGRECNAVDIPNNARLDFRGHNWVCNKVSQDKEENAMQSIFPIMLG